MKQRKILSTWSRIILAVLLGSQLAFAQDQPKIKNDDVYFIVSRYLIAHSEAPATSIVNTLAEVIEVSEIKISDKDGKATATIKERAPSNTVSVNKTIRLVFAPDGDKWKWESFENDRKLYPVDRLLPYTKDEANRRKQATEVKWAIVLNTMTAQADAAFKVLETAKAIIKSDPQPLGAVTTARTALAEARKGGDADAIIAAHKQVAQAIEPVAALADSFQDLKANDAYLRLQEELANAQKALAAARKDYVSAVEAYNDILQRLPFALAAYGLGFTKIEARIEAE